MAEHPSRADRITDLVLVATLLIFGAGNAVLLEIDDPPVPVLVAVGLAQLVSVPLRRTRPLLALALLVATTALGSLVLAPPQPLVWTVLAFALVRRPVRAAGGLLALAVIAVLAGCVAGARLVVTPFDAAVYVIQITPSIVLYTLVGGVVGRIARAIRDRESERARVEERVRTAAAIAVERNRIADELGSGVLDGLRRLTARTRQLAPISDADDPPSRTGAGLADPGPAVAALERDARTVLARMRRALATLRERTPAQPGGPPEPPAGTTPGSRWVLLLPTLSGVALTASCTLVVLAFGALPQQPVGEPGYDGLLPLLDVPWANTAALVSIGVQLLAVAWWRRAPTAGLLVATAAALTTASLGETVAMADSSWMVLVYGVAAGAPARRSGAVVALASGGWLVAYLAVPGLRTQMINSDAVTALSFLAVPLIWLTGVRHRARRLEAEAQRRARQDVERHAALDAERLRVARDLHDVVAHHVSAITVQAGAARVATDPTTRREAVGHIVGSGQRVAEALPELEGLTPDPGGTALTADDLENILRPVRAAGVSVTCEVHGEPSESAGDPELFARRILTEALTNVVRHAGASATRVRLDHDPDAVTLLVHDAGPAPGHRPHDHGSGLGVIGMRERAELLGGQVDAGPGPDGGWSVQARLPRTDPSSAAVVLRDEDVPSSVPSTTRP